MDSALVVRDLRRLLFEQKDQDTPVVVVIEGECHFVTGVDPESGFVRLEVATVADLPEDLA